MAANADQPLNQEGCVMMTWLAIGSTLALMSFAIILGAIIPDSIGMKRRIIELEEQQQELKEKIARLNRHNFS